MLISPQPWGVLHLSKHHYAIELAKAGNTVYFVAPPDNGAKSFTLNRIEGYNGLFEVRHKLDFKSSLRFRFRWIYDLYMKRHVGRLINWLGFIPDVTWCFDPNTYSNLKWFRAPLKIYHPVDPIVRADQIKPAYSADIVFSVSQKILSAFKYVKVPQYFINHGLSKPFEEQALKKLKNKNQYIPGKPVKVGYVGNLLRDVIDRKIVIRIIENNPQARFYFWGPFKAVQSNIDGTNDQDTTAFITMLHSLQNVVLYGPKSPEELAIEIQDMDIFFFTYKLIDGLSDRSNSHKILEYLSTGKGVFSCNIESYKDLDLLHMTSESADAQLPEKIGNGIEDLSVINSPQRMKDRIEYALENTYCKQINRIQLHLNTK
ncbi:glycosyltransferase family 4 protein [Fulvivirga sp. M361]|uniref:glycosyltransferase family 4 protein n=1 Tax=Fulvivirga sp. M361 TaxID=2594266 RepID=UPI00117B8BE3|nr:glycosyltransferase family 4 protein [Fulvivirga sp. M361]TRX50225.1 glycosyltransferase family 4 protein [Fulvivirga sp. M361]